MNEAVAKVLGNESQPMDVVQLLTRIKTLVRISRDEMSRYYDSWDRNDQIYRGEQIMDEADRQAAKRKEPTKFVLPITYTQINTFVAFALSVYNSRDYFYEMSGVSVEDEAAAKVAQMLLEQNLEYNNFRYQKLKQFLTDIAKYGIGVFKHSWRRDVDTVPQTVLQPIAPSIPGLEPVMAPVTVNKEVTRYLGNWIVSVTPFRFFPDPRLPLTRFQEGEFCASEDEYSRSMILEFEKQGLCAGTEWIPDLAQDQMVDRRHFGILNDIKPSPIMTRQKMYVILTEVQIWLNPAKTTIGGEPIDKSRDELVLYMIWYANDARIVRVEELNYPHGKFTYVAAQYEEDLINFINDGMADKLGPLQDTMNWFINSRITNVRKVLSNQLIVDPKGIEIQDLRDRKPVIRLKPAVQGTGTLDRWIKQLPIADVTTGHLHDLDVLDDYAKQTTGIVDNLLGQFSSGRRSAQEARSVNNNAATRVLGTLNAIWNSALLPQGRMMIANLRAGLDQQTMVRVIGNATALKLQQGVQNFMTVTPEQLEGDYDFLIFDGTLPSQRDAQAAILQELAQMILENPQAGVILGYDPQLLVDQILTYKGIRNADQYKLAPGKLQQLIQLGQVARNAMAPGGTQGANGGGNPKPGQQQAAPNYRGFSRTGAPPSPNGNVPQTGAPARR